VFEYQIRSKWSPLGMKMLANTPKHERPKAVKLIQNDRLVLERENLVDFI
jgi:hypothetical protein